MIRIASVIAFTSDVNSPVAPGTPRIPPIMWASREVPIAGAAWSGLSESDMATVACSPKPCRELPCPPMAATDRVKQILSWYSTDNTGVKTNLARLMNHGSLAGTGKFVILPVDQGFEHGPARSFAPNPPAYDPDYHFQLAIDAGCNAYAAPLGSLEVSADKFAGQVPLILKLNNSDTLAKMDQPCSAVTASVKDAVRLGCSAIGYTIYPGSSQRNLMYEELRELILEAKE